MKTTTMAGFNPSTQDVENLKHYLHAAVPGHELKNPIPLKLHQLKKLGTHAIGWKVLVESREGNYVGFMRWMLDHCDRLGLEQVSKPETGRKVGLVLVYYRLISRVTLLSKKTAPAALVQNSLDTNASCPTKKVVMPPEEQDEVSPQSFPPPDQGILRPNHWVIIDEIDDTYMFAMKQISQCSTVGLSCFGKDFGRNGSLSWLNIATETFVFLFDIGTLGFKTAFRAQVPEITEEEEKMAHSPIPAKIGSCKIGTIATESQEPPKLHFSDLMQVLKSEHIVKVVCDSRNMFDFFCHNSFISINAMHDIQAAEIYQNMVENKGKCPAFVPSITGLLCKYLQLQDQHLVFTRALEPQNVSLLLERPLQECLVKALACSVMFLCEVQKKQLKAIHRDLKQLTAVYAASYADVDDLKRARVEEYIVPGGVQALGKETVLPELPDRLGAPLQL